QPSVLARELADLGVVNVGAAGTFVVRKAGSQAAVRGAFLERLAFEGGLVVCRARGLTALADGHWVPGGSLPPDARRYLSVMGKRPAELPRLPLSQPAGEQWLVQVVGVKDRFVMSLCRRLGQAILYPNEVVEKRLGVPATTRNWNTVEAICEI